VGEEALRFIDSLRRTRIGGRYVVERVLGTGGMGLVAAARYPELDQQVAIKFMRKELAADATLSARFLREARLAARAKSPHFVRVFDFGRLNSGVPYLVMEMLRGRDLGAELALRGPLPLEEAVDYVLQAMTGLAEIHALGVVHRDLKPANLFLAEAAGTRTIKVLDLGISKESAVGLTSSLHLVGTPHYMSPEQIRESKSVDRRCDVWALGVSLHELLTKSVPLGEGCAAAGEVFGCILHMQPTPIRQRRPDLPEAVEALILKCLRRDPGERYGDLAELAEALRPFAGPSSVGRVDTIRQALAERADSAKGEAIAEQPTLPLANDDPMRLALAQGAAPSTVQGVSAESPRRSRAGVFVAFAAAFTLVAGIASTFFVLRGAGPGTIAAAEAPVAAPSSAQPSIAGATSPVSASSSALPPAEIAVAPLAAPQVSASASGGPAPRPPASGHRGVHVTATAAHAIAPPHPSASAGIGAAVLDGMDRK
jgi:serine/threonine-protein kinase